MNFELAKKQRNNKTDRRKEKKIIYIENYVIIPVIVRLLLQLWIHNNCGRMNFFMWCCCCCFVAIFIAYFPSQLIIPFFFHSLLRHSILGVIMPFITLLFIVEMKTKRHHHPNSFWLDVIAYGMWKNFIFIKLLN